MKKKTLGKLIGVGLALAMIISLFVLVPTAGASGGSVTAAFNEDSSVMNGAYINANGTGTVSHKETTAGYSYQDFVGNYYINGVLMDSKLFNNAMTGTATAGTTKVEVMIKNLSTGKSLVLAGTNGAGSTWSAEDTYNTASGTTSWTLNMQGFAGWTNGNYIAVARAFDDDYGAPVTISFNIFNAQIVNPTFDDAIKGAYTFRVDAIDLDGIIDSVYANVVNIYDGSVLATVPLTPSEAVSAAEGALVFEGAFDSTSVPSEVYMLDVHAIGDGYDGRVFHEFVVENESLLPEDPASVNPDNPREFLLDGEPFRYGGTNNRPFYSENMQTKTADSHTVTWIGDEQLVRMIPSGTRWRFEEWVDRTFLEMRKSGLRVARIWAMSATVSGSGAATNGQTSTNMRHLNTTTGAITYSESQLSRLDYILYSAAKHGCMVSPTLEDYWNTVDSKVNYVKTVYDGNHAGFPRDETVMAPTTGGQPRTAFFVSEGCWDTYANLIETFTSREGTLANGTKVTWKGNPAIFSWCLFNEPRFGLDQDTTIDGLYWEGDGMDAKEYFFEYDGETDTWKWRGTMTDNGDGTVTVAGRMLPNLPAVGTYGANSNDLRRIKSFTEHPEKFGVPPEETKLYKWIDRAASYFKELDPTHMVVSGAESQTQSNPAAPYVTNVYDGSQVQMPWAGWTSQGYGGDPLAATSPPSIDYVTYHPYIFGQWGQTGAQDDHNYIRTGGVNIEDVIGGNPSASASVKANWAAAGHYRPDQAMGVIESLAARAAELNKPLVIEELGPHQTFSTSYEQGNVWITSLNTRYAREGRLMAVNKDIYAAAYTWTWVVQFDAALRGGVAGFNSWQGTLRRNSDHMGFALYYAGTAANQSATPIINNKVDMDYYRRASEEIWNW